MEIAKVVGSSQPADAQRQAKLDLDNYLFHSVKKMECTYVKENLLETRNNLLYPESQFQRILSDVLSDNLTRNPSALILFPG